MGDFAFLAKRNGLLDYSIMSVALATQEIKRFLRTEDPEVLYVMGKWGVGKTYLWNLCLKDAALDKEIGLKNYSYVSLFGQNSLEDLKYSIFENTQNVESMFQGGDIKKRLKNQWRKASQIAFFIPGIKDYPTLLARSYFLAVRNQIVCIDDLERAGAGLSAKDVLGIVSFLKEQRKCKVILLLNNEALGEDQVVDFNSQLEKVADIAIRFEPTAQEAAEIGIDKSTQFHEQLAKICITLEIINIRIIRKIERLARELHGLLMGHNEKIFESALISITLFGWMVYEPKHTPTIEFVKNFFFFLIEKQNEGKESEKEKKWRLILNRINFTHFDDLDQILFDSAVRGYFDPTKIEEVANALDQKYRGEEGSNSLSEAWEKYRGSFKSSAEEVLEEMASAIKNGAKWITPLNLDGTIVLFRRFGKDSEADQLIDFYMQERNNEPRDFYDPRKSLFLRFRDVTLENKFRDKLASFKDERTPEDILTHIAESNG